MHYSWHWAELLGYWSLFARGLWLTLVVGLLSILVGTLLACIIVTLGRSRTKPFRWLSKAYTDVFRALPVFVLLGLTYFVLPMLIEVRLSPFVAAVISFSLNLAPFAAECIRAGIDAVPRIQYESARALGLSRSEALRFVVVPQALQHILPPLLGQYVTTIKLTSLAGAIGVMELWNTSGQVVARTSLPLEARLAASLLYVALLLPLIWGVGCLEQKAGLRGALSRPG